MTAAIAPPDPSQLLAPILPAIPPAAVSTHPAIGILPLLSPILRQRVNLLSESSTEPWLRLLCYDTAKAAKLTEIAQGSTLEPHPVSGEVEVDWDYDAQIRYRRIDEETLQAFVVLCEIGLAFQLVYCVNDQEGGGDGWRLGEVTTPDGSSPFAQFGGSTSISEAERQFHENQAKQAVPSTEARASNNLDVPRAGHEADEDEDDDYWARYDATPARTPAQKPSPAPQSLSNSATVRHQATSAEDDYFAQYDDVQPAMDNHDPDEEAHLEHVGPSIGIDRVATRDFNEVSEINETNGTWTLADVDKSETSPAGDGGAANGRHDALLHPRPASSASSNGSNTIAKLEATADKQDQNEFGVKQHVSRSIRSLYLLARASGIDREEFERLVHSELDILGMVEDHS